MSEMKNLRKKEILAYLVESIEKIFGKDVECLLVHGSMAKGGVIQGFSDLDIQVFLKKNSFDEFGLKLEKCLGIQNLIGDLDVSKIGAKYLQMDFYNAKALPDYYTPPFEGSYQVLLGKYPPELSISTKAFKEKIKQRLKQLPQEINSELKSFADKTNQKAYRQARLVATVVFPIMYSLVSYNYDNPGEIWVKDKFSVLELFQQKYKKQIIASYLSDFFNQVKKLGKNQDDYKLAKKAFTNGILFLKEAAKVDFNIPNS
jgi:hypothetical protein